MLYGEVMTRKYTQWAECNIFEC